MVDQAAADDLCELSDDLGLVGKGHRLVRSVPPPQHPVAAEFVALDFDEAIGVVAQGKGRKLFSIDGKPENGGSVAGCFGNNRSFGIIR